MTREDLLEALMENVKESAWNTDVAPCEIEDALKHQKLSGGNWEEGAWVTPTKDGTMKGHGKPFKVLRSFDIPQPIYAAGAQLHYFNTVIATLIHGTIQCFPVMSEWLEEWRADEDV